MDLEVSHARDGAARPRTTLTVRGYIDRSSSERLLDVGLRVLWADAGLALDLSRVEFMDAAGVAALSALGSAAQRLGARFEITAVSFSVHRVLQILDLTTRWSVPRPTPAEAH